MYMYTLIRVGPPGYFTHISITTPIVPALKNDYTRYLELSRSPNGFFKVLLDPGGGFVTAVSGSHYTPQVP